MAGKFPNDRVRDRQDAPETYDRHRERFTQAEAGLRDADDPVAGARPETEPAGPLPVDATEAEGGDSGA